MEQIKLSEFTLKRIKNKEFKKFIPELYELEEVIENNLWHNNDSVLNHSISVSIELKELFKKLNKRVRLYLNRKMDSHSRKELLFLAAIFHDIGKRETFKKEKDITQSLGHEEIGAVKLKKILPRFNLSEKEREFVVKIVKNHSFFHEILNYPEENPEKKTEAFKKKHPDVFLELILLTIADMYDMYGSQLKLNKPEEFNFRMSFFNKIINNY
ncbi:MAG: HD domain-containing protein [Patescibacteria group bacterium]|nr:HD domain-containing protein [Patescibacteria group bacterium]